MNVLVIYGGGFSEHEVSIRSGRSVGAALGSRDHIVTYYDPSDDADYKTLPKYLTNIDVVFPIVHGLGGEDGRLQAELERLGVPFVGSGSKSSEVCFDKWFALQVVRKAGIQIPETDYITYDDLADHPLTKHPYVLKPARDGSSIGVFLVREPKIFDITKTKEAFDTYDRMLIEELIEGIEITAPILGDESLPIIEIIPPSGKEFDYENKYNGETQELCPPVHVPKDVQRKAQDIALAAHKTLGCRHLSRTDIIWVPNGSLYYLETNTLPGMTDHSLYPKSAAVNNIDIADLVDTLITMACA